MIETRVVRTLTRIPFRNHEIRSLAARISYKQTGDLSDSTTFVFSAAHLLSFLLPLSPCHWLNPHSLSCSLRDSTSQTLSYSILVISAFRADVVIGQKVHRIGGFIPDSMTVSPPAFLLSESWISPL